MAKRYKKARRFFGRAKKFYSRHKAAIKPLNAVLYGGIYGAVRNHAHSMTASLTNMIPLGQYSDEAAYGVLGYFLAKQSNPMMKNAGMAILTIEAASVGQQALGGMMGGVSGSSFKGY